MENVNANINFKQYFIIPILGIALIYLGWSLSGNKSTRFENEYFSFDLSQKWLANTASENGETSFLVVEDPYVKTTVKKIESYIFGIEAGHVLYNESFYSEFLNKGTKAIVVKGKDGIYFDLEYLDLSSGEPINMIGKEIVFPVGEELYLIGMYAPEEVSDEYLSSFNELVESVDIKN